MEAMLENKKAMAIEKINLLMENKEKKFNPLLNFTLTKVLSEIAPQFYTEQELTQIEEISQSYCQAMKDNTTEEDKVNNKRRCRSSDEGSVSYGERRVKPKSTRESEKQNKETILSPPPKLPTLVENKIKELNGHDIRYIMCKKLYWSDLDKNKKRLSMPIKKEKLDFLLDIEKEILEDNIDNSDELKVIVLDPCFRKFTMSLRKWYMGTSSVYNLIQDWNFVVSKNSFEIGQLLDIWSFRDVNNKLHFVLDDYKNSLITNIALHTAQVKLEIEGCGKLENSGDWEPNNIEESNKKQKEEGEE